MPHVFVDPFSRDFSATGKLGVSHQPRRAQVLIHAPEDQKFKKDQQQSDGDAWPRRRIRTKNSMAKINEAQRDRKPGKQQTRSVSGLAVPPPKIYVRVHDKPIKRDGELEKKNKSSEPAEKDHPHILVEDIAGNKAHASGPHSPRLAAELDFFA